MGSDKLRPIAAAVAHCPTMHGFLSTLGRVHFTVLRSPNKSNSMTEISVQYRARHRKSSLKPETTSSTLPNWSRLRRRCRDVQRLSPRPSSHNMAASSWTTAYTSQRQATAHPSYRAAGSHADRDVDLALVVGSWEAYLQGMACSGWERVACLAVTRHGLETGLGMEVRPCLVGSLRTRQSMFQATCVRLRKQAHLAAVLESL